jgi:alkane 1-monooxygenase
MNFNHLLSLIFPVSTLGFFLSGPHTISGALVWTVPFWIVLILDWKGPNYQEPPLNEQSTQFYDGIIYSLALLQFVNIGLMLVYISALPWNSQADFMTGIVNLLTIRFLVGTSSGTSAVVVAHELIHRPQQHMQLLGRLVLCTLCYEHFTIAHKQGHHLTIGLPEDITTARLDESYKRYWRRVYSSHLKYVWNLELERLQVKDAPFSAITLLKSQVVQGFLVEVGLVLIIFDLFGWLAAAFFLYQAFVAVRIIEAINYVQHWGLQEGRFGNSYGWVCNSWITKYSLISLSHHIGHHLDETRPFYEIPYSDQGPIMPYGYFVMNLWAKIHNASYQKMAERALEQFRARQVAA